jgi:ketosteroid isomerase-like protein
MSQENIEIIRRLYRAVSGRDVPSLLELLHPDVEWTPLLGVLEGRVYYGPEGVRHWMDDLAGDWEFFEVHYDEFRNLDDRVLVLGHWRARGRVSGVEVEDQPATWLFEFKGRKVVRLQTYTDRGEAFEAAGLSAQDVNADSS